MKIVYKVGNVIEAEEPIIAHGCNAQGVMGSGVAKAIKEAFPGAFADYRATFDRKQLIVGRNTYYHEPDGGKTIVNMVTQERYGRDRERRYVDYAAVRTCMKELNVYQLIPCVFGKDISVAMPLIGCGLGNGSWAVISRIIEEEATNFQPVVYCLSERELHEALSPIGPAS